MAKTNSAILFDLNKDFNEIVNSFPGDALDLINGDGDLQEKKSCDITIKRLKTEISQGRSELKDFSQKISFLEHQTDLTNNLISESKIKLAQIKVQQSSMEESISFIRKNLTQEESLLSEIKKERAINSEKVKQLNLDKEKLLENRTALNREEDNFKKEIKSLNEQINKIRNFTSAKESKLTKKRESLSNLTLQIERYNFESEHLENKVEELYMEFLEKYSIELEEAGEEITEFLKDEVDLKTKTQELKVKQKMIGQINLMAPEEFVEVSKRYHFLKEQIEDLKKADEDLSLITKEIEEESKRLFFKTFQEIKTSFSIMYQQLFGGGSAELTLTDQSNMLESGIEIFARPPGKSLENISLLSGGERSLTAVALLFATYSIKPSPFCILDEIDAALDERNISRFVSTLTEFAKESQFIVITHNKKTVTGAGTLLGVTMEESGVSKLITMRLEHEEEQ